MRLPDDFWSVNEDEPGMGGVIAALIVLVIVLTALFVLPWLTAPAGAGAWPT